MSDKKILVITSISVFLSIILIINRKRVFDSLIELKNYYAMLNLQKDFGKKILKLGAYAKNETDWDIIAISGHRDWDKSVDLKSYRSLHPFGRALDVNLRNRITGKKITMASTKEEWESTGIPQKAISLGLRWGGNFVNYVNYLGKKGDNVHFDDGSDFDELMKKGLALYQNDKKSVYDNGYLV